MDPIPSDTDSGAEVGLVNEGRSRADFGSGKGTRQHLVRIAVIASPNRLSTIS
jgi:hypothetical protein